MTVVVKKIGGSLAVVIPRSVAAGARPEVGSQLDVTSTAEGVPLQAPIRRPRRPVRELARQVKPGSYEKRSAELLRDPAVGKEPG